MAEQGPLAAPIMRRRSAELSPAFTSLSMLLLSSLHSRSTCAYSGNATPAGAFLLVELSPPQRNSSVGNTSEKGSAGKVHVGATPVRVLFIEAGDLSRPGRLATGPRVLSQDSKVRAIPMLHARSRADLLLHARKGLDVRMQGVGLRACW